MMEDIDSRLFFSDDRTAFAVKTDRGIYINLTGKRVDEPKNSKEKQ